MTDKRKRPAIGWSVALVLLPALLAVGTIGAVIAKIRVESRTGPDARLALAPSAVNAGELRQLYAKLADLVGPRDWQSVDGRTRIRRAIAFIDGTLSPQNYGFEVRRGGAASFGEELWPTLWVDLPGRGEGAGAVVVAVPYDRGDFGVAAVLAIANDLRGKEMARTVRLVFYPSQLLEKTGGAGFLVAEAPPSRVVLCIPSFSSRGESLWVTDGSRGGPHPVVTADGRIETQEGPARSIEAEKAVFAPLGAPVYVCRGTPGEEDPPGGAPPAGEDAAGPDGEAFDRYLTRTILLRNLIRDLGEAGTKRP